MVEFQQTNGTSAQVSVATDKQCSFVKDVSSIWISLNGNFKLSPTANILKLIPLLYCCRMESTEKCEVVIQHFNGKYLKTPPGIPGESLT